MASSIRAIPLALCVLICAGSVTLAQSVPFHRGDANGADGIDLSDGVFVLNFLFVGGATPSCLDAADANDSGEIDISDGIYLLDFLFLGGRPPAAPFESCGDDATDDGLDCASYGDCVDVCPGAPDVDSDGDGVLDCLDGCPEDADKTDPGLCGCGVPDTDSDADGVADCVDACPGAPDVDSDGDGVPDCLDGCPSDPNKIDPGTCGCGVDEVDSDGDGTPDCADLCPSDPNKVDPGLCGCGVDEVDSDGDGTPDCTDLCPIDAAKTDPGTCGCGVEDTDPDCAEAVPGFTFIGMNEQGYREYRYDRLLDDYGVEMVFVLLPGGEFLMGSPENPCAGPGETLHEVRLSPFLIAKHEVSQRAWLAVMGANPSCYQGAGCDPLPQSLRENEAWLDLPVEQVSWEDISGAGGFLARTGLALPTESQWEYACRGGTTTPFAFGDCISTDQVNFTGFSEFGDCTEFLCEPLVYRVHTVPVAPDDERWSGGVFGVIPANPFGLYHMHGNVFEYCSDLMGEYPTSPVTDPEGPAIPWGRARVLRGGSSQHSAPFCRSAYRGFGGTSEIQSIWGFRAAMRLR